MGLALADDIVIHAKGELSLKKVINEVQEESKRLGIEVSDTKSAVMEIQRGRRRPLKRKMIYGFPATQEYKYLGVIINQKLNFKEDLIKRRNI